MHIPIPAFGESLPKTKCHIRIDDPHISKFLRLKKQIEAVKVNASSICNKDMSNLKLTVEIFKVGLFRDYKVAEFTRDYFAFIPANKRIENTNTFARCQTSRPSRYYGIAHATALINGQTVKTLKVITNRTISLPCGT